MKLTEVVERKINQLQKHDGQEGCYQQGHECIFRGGTVETKGVDFNMNTSFHSLQTEKRNEPGQIYLLVEPRV